MTPEDIRSVINAVLSDKILLSYPQLFCFVLLSGIAAYLGAYLKKKAENLATHEDVEALTRAVEEVKNTYSKQIEDYKQELSRRAQAARVSEALARAFYGNDTKAIQDVQLLWELSIWLPAELVRKLSECLVHGKDPRDVLVQVRKLLHGTSDNVLADEIIQLSVKHNNPPKQSPGVSAC